MAVYNVDLPYPPDHDHAQQLRDQQDERIRARMSRSAYLADIQQSFADALREADNPIEECAEMLFSAPLRDIWDHKAFLNSQLRDTKRLGEALLRVLAAISLEHYQQAADEEMF
jgi:hypothetical protein